jgi:ribonuclease P/MRP protein subunit POP5
MIKLKGLKPSLREKKRYIVYQVISEEDIKMHPFQDALIKEINLMLGIFIQGGLLPIKYDNKSKKGIIRVNHTIVDKVRTCFVLIKSIDNISVSINTIGVSGILKKAKEYL